MPATDANRLTETSVNLVIDWIRSNIDSALSDVRDLRTDNLVTTEPPRAYMIHVADNPYRLPAVYVISTGMDFRLDRGPNHISAVENMFVAVLVEARNSDQLQRKVWRYQAALAKLMQNTALLSGDGSVKLITKLVRSSFSGITEVGDTTASPESLKMFRQEAVLEIEAEHYEQF